MLQQNRLHLLIIKGSYHKNGNITSLINSLSDGFKSKNINNTIEIIDLVDMNINFCTGCKVCCNNASDNKQFGDCIYNDDMKVIINKMLQADRIVLASPIYNCTITAIMKKFTERCISLTKYLDNSWPKYRNNINKLKKSCIILSTDCPWPINKLFLLTFNAFYILKTILRCVEINNIKTLPASTYQLKLFLKRAFKLGIYLSQ